MRKIVMFVLLLVNSCLMSSCAGKIPPNQGLPPNPVTAEQVVADETFDNPDNTDSNSSVKPTRIRISAGDAVLHATLYDNRTAQEFAELLPLTLDAFDRIGLVKSTVLPRSISEDGERTREYAVGAIFYWPEGPEVAFCYSDHLPETVVEIIHIGMIEEGAEFFQSYEGEILIELEEEDTMQTTSDMQSKTIKMMIGDVEITAELNDSDIARQFAALLPQTITMSRGRDREYYGRIDGTLSYNEADIQKTAEDGDLAYWFSGNSLAFFFNTENDSAVNSGIVVFGKITSDLSVFDNMDSSEVVTVTLLH